MHNYQIDVKTEDGLLMINAAIHRATECDFINPYVAYEYARKILSYCSIFLPSIEIKGEAGYNYINIFQFGFFYKQSFNGSIHKSDILPHNTDHIPSLESEPHPDPIPDVFEVDDKDPDALYFYFEHELQPNGRFKVFCELVSHEDLQDLIKDFD